MSRFAIPFASLALGAALSITSAGASAQLPDHTQMQAHGQMASQDANALSTGEIKRVNKDLGKLTIQHGPLVNLNMPGMTMAFKVQDPAMLEQVKVGDKIRFRVERINGALMITKLDTSK